LALNPVATGEARRMFDFSLSILAPLLAQLLAAVAMVVGVAGSNGQTACAPRACQ
jgi:hypothetical protein